ncbi:MAG TPA: ABC transporter permease [Isosphaeraceae bacterium]|nr:ABC transporter permease [Isosphaeraceae bacterium]
MRFTTLIFRNLLRRRMRTTLTVVGLAIGISAVVALLGIAWGFERSFMTIYKSKGIDLIVVRAGTSDRLTSNIEESLGERLKAVPGVKALAASLTDVVSFEQANLASVLAQGWEPGSMLFRGIRILSGRALRQDDKNAVMFGRVLAMNLQKKVGDPVDISGERFEVVGIYESDSIFENGGLLMPLKHLQWMMGRQGQVTAFVVSAEGAPEKAAIERLRDRIEKTLPKMAALPAHDFVQSDIQIRLAKAMAWATSVIAFILGSVGMLNTMVMAVFERTREIGVLRALGWRRKRVLTLIMGEALALGLAGACLGTGLGYVGVRALSVMPTARGFITSDLPPEVLLVGLGLGVGLSVLGGLYPAVRGASLEPTEALRYE